MAGQFLAGNTDNFNFEVVKNEEYTELYWMHTEGRSVNDYAIERSVNGSSFEEISIQRSSGSAVAELYNDFDIAPAIGDNQYRVKIYFKDGTIGYSETILVHFADLIDFTLFPNPASDFIKVNLETVVGKEAVIQIINSQGVPVKDIQLDKIYSKYYQIDLRDLKEGHYVIWVQAAQHKAVAKQFVIGKP